MSRSADLLVIDPRDNVATALRALQAGGTARVASAPGAPPSRGDAPAGDAPAGRGDFLLLLQAIPAFHKAALTGIAAGEAVIKYGEAIGAATRDIRAGEHVHVHNLAGRRVAGRPGPEHSE